MVERPITEKQDK